MRQCGRLALEVLGVACTQSEKNVFTAEINMITAWYKNSLLTESLTLLGEHTVRG